MQKITTLILLLCIIVTITGSVWFFLRKQSGSSSTSVKGFKWGVVLHPNSQLLPIDRVIDSQLKLAKSVGAGWVKTDHITNLGDEYNDAIVASAKKQKVNLMFIIDWQLQDIEPFKEQNIETRAYDTAFRIAHRYKNRVSYYQISSEPGGLVLKSPFLPGIEPADYDEQKYQQIKAWIRGTLRGIGDADSKAKRVMVGQFLHVGFFDRLDKDGLTPLYDTIGWDLYSDVGDDLTSVIWSGGQFALLEKLKSFGKEILLTEVARRDGTTDGKESAVGDYYVKVSEKLSGTGVTGFFAYELTDQPEVPGTQANYGLVSLEKESDGSYRLGEPKAAYDKLKELIRASKLD